MALTWRDASIEALKMNGVSSAADIVRVITERNLREVTGSTPEATVGAVLYTAVQDGDPRVRTAGPGLFEHTGSTVAPRTTVALSRLEAMDPRDVWSDEARDFTPWLMENAQYLGEVLGIDVEFEAREHPVGAFSLDIYGRDVTNECVLIVENQLADTDHKHLGQLLTYAAGTDAATIVWVAPRFRDEHRQALEFLNNKTGDDARFFGVEVSVVRIGDSSPAPMFNLVAKPSEWRSQVAASKTGSGLSERRELYRGFWTNYLETLHAQHPLATNVRSPSTRNWTNINYLRRGINVTLAFLSNNQVSCEVYIDIADAESNSAVLSELVQHRGEVENAVGEPLQWEDIPLKRACRIRAVTSGDVSDLDSHAALIEWMINHQLKMKSAIKPLVEKLPDALWDTGSAD